MLGTTDCIPPTFLFLYLSVLFWKEFRVLKFSTESEIRSGPTPAFLGYVNVYRDEFLTGLEECPCIVGSEPREECQSNGAIRNHPWPVGLGARVSSVTMSDFYVGCKGGGLWNGILCFLPYVLYSVWSALACTEFVRDHWSRDDWEASMVS